MSNHLRDNRKLAFNQVENKIVGSNAAIIGNRSQLYDLRQEALNARENFSFTIKHARIIDIGTCAISSPRYDDLKSKKLKFWFSNADYSYTDVSKKYDAIFAKARAMNLIQYDYSSGEVVKNFSDPSVLLETCGNELKTWLDSPQDWMSRKIKAIDGIVILDQINREKPFFDEIKPSDFGIQKETYVSLISLMETFGIIKVTQDDRMIPYLSFEIYGDRITDGLDDLLEDKFNRTIFEWCRKMPGISINKIQSLACENFPEYEKKIVHKSFQNIIFKMQENGYIELHNNKDNSHSHIIPVWLRNSILQINPSRIESDMVKNAILSCGQLWEQIDGLNEYSVFIDNIKDSLNDIATGKEITFKEILDIDSRLNPLLVSFHDNGILAYDRKTSNFSVKSETTEILETVLNILKMSEGADLWMEFVKGKPTYESMSGDLENASKEIHDGIADRYTAKDLNKFSEYN